MIHGDVPPVDPLRVIRLTPGQIRRVLNLLQGDWDALDDVRRGETGGYYLSEQQDIEAIQAELRRAL